MLGRSVDDKARTAMMAFSVVTYVANMVHLLREEIK